MPAEALEGAQEGLPLPLKWKVVPMPMPMPIPMTMPMTMTNDAADNRRIEYM